MFIVSDSLFAAVKANRSSKIEVTNQNNVILQGNGTDYEIYVSDLAGNNMVRITGTKADNLTITRNPMGLILNGDDLHNINVKVFSDN